jgi:hypothetical protein
MTWLKWKLASVHLETLLISAQDRCMVYAECTMSTKTFLATQRNFLGDIDQMEARSVRLEIVLTSTQDRCTVCARRAIRLETILDAPDGTPR